MVRDNLRAIPTLILLDRFGTVDEVADVVVLLAANDYTTGQTVSANGGRYIL